MSFYQKYLKNPKYIPLFPFILFCLLFLATHALAENIKKVEIIAHQGVLEDVPENTFAALKRVAELGIDGIGVDIRQTKDNQLILMCDETIDRTTDGKGRVDQLTYAEIKQYDAGSWRSAEFIGERVPLLSDVLRFCKVNNIKLLLNIKQTHLEKQVTDLVKAFEMSSQVYLWGTLRNLAIDETDPLIKEIVFLSSEEIKEEKIVRINEEKKYAFSIVLGNDSRKILKDRIKRGIDVILTDYPYVAMDILNIKNHITTQKKQENNRSNLLRKEEDSNPLHILERVKTLVETIEDADYDKSRTAALAILVLPNKYTVPHLIRLLKNKHPHARQNAAWALGFCDDKDIAAYIHPALKDKNAEVRREAVLALRRLGNNRSVAILIEALKTEKDQWVRYDIARTLGAFRNRSAVFTLTEVLAKDKNWYVKSACAEALGHIGSDKAINTLAKVLVTDAGENAAWTRMKAAWALAEIGKKSIPSLINALRDNEEVTRRRAGWALIKIGTPAVNALISSLHEINGFTRERAARTLGWIGSDRADTSLIWALKDKEPSVVSSAAWALGRIGSAKALPALQVLTFNKNEDVRENAIEAIERIKAIRKT